MKVTKCCSVSFIFAVLCLHVFQSANGVVLMNLGDITDVIQFGKEITIDVLESWDLFARDGPEDNYGGEYYPFMKRNEKRLMKKISALSTKIELFEYNSNLRITAAFENVIRQLDRQTDLSNHLTELNQQISRVSRSYQDFKRYANSTDKWEQFTLQEFVIWCVSPGDGIPNVLERIHDLIVPDKNGFGNKNLLELLANSLKEASGSICNDKQSPQQLLYNLYNSIAVTEIKGYAMIQFSWLLLRLYKQGNFTEEAELTKTKYETRMSETVKAVQTAMAFASQDLWKCDPTYPTPETYTELTSFLQSYVVNEVDLNSENTCRENCGYYNYAKVHSCFKNQYCSKQKRCNGKLYNCQYIDSDMWICPAEENSGRRYNYIEYENGRVFGQKGTCSRGTTKVDSWWRWLFWHCSYCVCFCDDHSHDSDRYFNLREVVADIESNKVITGIKFVKVNQVIHLQIEQGELLQRGRISNVTEWKPVDEYNVLDADLKEGLDYLTLSWDQRAIDLDDLTAAPGYLLTGIRFRSLGSHLNLEIMSTPFNFTTGVLVKPLEKSVWHGNDNTDASKPNPRTVLELNKPDRSTRSELQSLPDSKSDQYVLFSPSDLDKDAAQSTVPFIDTQAVTPYPRTPIAGAGIYHKGRSGFGGYIAPKLRTYNFAPHLHVDHTLSRPIIRIGENLIGKPMIN
ncbi:uncharacterized protein LOC105686340 isoform X1 [Athalia rosae]|uniref:uncharacterized protein LOC105686340 isoform X1 n=1 Tax=Athalia rosae TaxID=37344 RepID=UPI0020349EA6|nr:uncharacterized protein LOC105686340 isoform X1 [Athalia rosae]